MHTINIRKSYDLLEKLKSFKKPEQVISYLKQIDPYLMEELVLSALKNHNHAVTRNSRYSGDGGIDGKAVIYGKKYFVQTKRYKDHISKNDLLDFSFLCKKNNVRGLFVHTGKTGKGAKGVNFNSKHIEIISGERLVRLIQNKDFGIKGKFLYLISNYLFSFKKGGCNA